MAIQIKVLPFKGGRVNGKWYGKAVKTGEVTTEELARRISKANSVTESDVYGVIIALVKEMRSDLADGHTVVLDGLGRFHLTVNSDLVDSPEEYNVARHIRRVVCKFTPWAHRNPFNRRLDRSFCDGVEVVRAAF